MDLGCIDMGCIEKEGKEISPEKQSSSGSSSSDSATATSKIGKNKATRDSGQSNWNAFSKCASQIRKPPRRKTSPLNWFPRKKVDSYLKRKIQMLQEVDGMNSTLDETLGDSNPHYSRVLKEKIAVKEAATKAMEARKAAMIEASWCRILKAASIDCKDAEAQLVEAEKVAAEAFEAATALGVTMYDIADCPQRSYMIEMSTTKGGSATHTVSASFETAFEVDKQVAYAVKSAFSKLANCSSIKEDEFRELLRKISQNPDSDDFSDGFSEIASECESDTGSEFDVVLHDHGFVSQDCPDVKKSSGVNQYMVKKGQVSEKFNMANLAELMLERLKGLQEDELSSLATIVSTCGLSAVLAQEESVKKNDLDCSTNNQTRIPVPRRISTFGARSFRSSGVDGQRKGMDDTELPSLDKFLVKKLTRLEREVLEAKNAREGDKQQISETDKRSGELVRKEAANNDSVPGLGDVLVKHSSKLEKEIENARKNNPTTITKKPGKNGSSQDVSAVPSLDKFLVKHKSRLEREVHEAKSRRNFEQVKDSKVTDSRKCTSNPDISGEETISSEDMDPSMEKENISLNQNEDNDMDHNRKGSSMRGHHRSMLSQQRSNSHDSTESGYESLDKVLVKHVSRLEREKLEFQAREGVTATNVRRANKEKTDKSYGESSLDQVLVKHKSRLEREKMAAAAAADQPSEKHQVLHSVARREARQKELQDAWGGLSLGNSMRPHLSRLQRDKASTKF
ncbi:OLC1v1002950C6 [Oldenlandia corymbosa var. corymbosa]|uniref:OLC1v1002950C6 n=2 Tax=Oldenlandia corymbosa var. corymbosa TaxID=529605 RepID=A0AAV1D8X7_OLDCO|nr:OLC1v1002950C6 [Oldenlandia corymbosa var. corymbosa]